MSFLCYRFLLSRSDRFRSAPRGEEVGFAHLLIGAAAHIVSLTAVELRNCLCRRLIAHGYGLRTGELRRCAVLDLISRCLRRVFSEIYLEGLSSGSELAD